MIFLIPALIGAIARFARRLVARRNGAGATPGTDAGQA